MGSLKTKFFLALLGSLTTLCNGAAAQGPPKSEDSAVPGTSFLDHDAYLSKLDGKTFLKDNIPFIDVPDANIQEVYYYRMSLMARHLKYGRSTWVTTEFIQEVHWNGPLHAIVAAAGHQIDETRWLRSRYFADDYIEYWNRGPGDFFRYSDWSIDAAYRRAMVTGDMDYAASQVEGMDRLMEKWRTDRYDENAGLYFVEPVWDAQERSLPGFVFAEQTGDDEQQWTGPLTYRISLNAYMYANSIAISSLAKMVGNTELESKYATIAEELLPNIYNRLWDPDQEFLVDIIRTENPDLRRIQGKQLIGLYPFRFNVGLNKTITTPSMAAAFDPNVFYTEFGPATLEISNKFYMADVPTCCWWNGQSWPFSTSHVLKSIAAVIRSGDETVNRDMFTDYLGTYASTQRKNSVPYVAEQHFPHKDAWSGDGFNHSEHYFHSTFGDEVITGLMGIVPHADDVLEIDPLVPDSWTWYALENVPYKGHLVSYIYDRDGSHYNKGNGLTVFVDNEQVYQGEAKYPYTTPITNNGQGLRTYNMTNVAANPLGLGAWPKASATYTYRLDDPYKAIDGYVFYDRTPDNRWSNFQSTSGGKDTLTIEFPRPQEISSVTIALYADDTKGGKVKVPASITIRSDDDTVLVTADDGFLANDKNTLTFKLTTTKSIAIELTNQPDSSVGICEVEVWAPRAESPYFAVDGYLVNGAVVSFDEKSKATPNGAVVDHPAANSTTTLASIASDGGDATLTLSYSNSGGGAVSVSVLVNQVEAGKAELATTGGEYKTVEVPVKLGKGNNFIDVKGGGEGVKLETVAL